MRRWRSVQFCTGVKMAKPQNSGDREKGWQSRLAHAINVERIACVLRLITQRSGVQIPPQPNSTGLNLTVQARFVCRSSLEKTRHNTTPPLRADTDAVPSAKSKKEAWVLLPMGRPWGGGVHFIELTKAEHDELRKARFTVIGSTRKELLDLA